MKLNILFAIISLCSFNFICVFAYGDLRDTYQKTHAKDTVLVLVDSSRSNRFKKTKRKEYANKAYQLFKENSKYITKSDYLTKIAYAYYKLDDSLAYRKVSKHAIKLSLDFKDSVNLANNYWDMGNFYSKNGIKDSAYYMYSSAQKLYDAIDNQFYSGRMLLNMAIMQSDIKDYTGSDITTIKAIEILKPLKEYKHLYRCFNNLGINFNNLGEYDKALFYHRKALEYQKRILTKNSYKENTLNNIGVVYKNKKDYVKAIYYYQQALKEGNLKKDNLKLYAKVVDNLAYSKFKLGDLKDTEAMFYESLHLRDSINDYQGLAVNKLHLTEFYISKKDTVKALQLANQVKRLATDTENFRDLMSVLKLLPILDPENHYKYTRQYIILSDSLVKEERTLRDKFTRIRFETDEFIDKNKRLNRQLHISLFISGLLILIGFLSYVITKQRMRYKELMFKQRQQQANEEIYKLMIDQQNKLDEGSRKEKKRISKELHDGVLGKIFGARLILGTLNAKNDDVTIKKREKYIEELQDIEEEIRNLSHKLHHDSSKNNIGYAQMIEKLLEDQSKITKFTYEFNYDIDIKWDDLDGALKMNFYRILQEAFQNINKHAKADHVKVNFKIEDKALLLTIEDNGVGFNVDSKRKGIGLYNMKKRLENFKGNLVIKSKALKGTVIIIRTPYISQEK